MANEAANEGAVILLEGVMKLWKRELKLRQVSSEGVDEMVCKEKIFQNVNRVDSWSVIKWG